MSGAAPERPLLAWLGDDFTGAAAVAEALTFAGLPAAVFLEPPTPADLEALPGLRGVGLAGTARARGATWMDSHLPAAFATLAGLGAELSLHKVCSTLDSSPAIGSIGRAVELARDSFAAGWSPVLAAAPPLGRWQAFGTLFATGPGGIHRLDRHPIMSRHPATPMDEADVARHLARQTTGAVSALTLPDMADIGLAEAALDRLLRAGASLVTLDCVDDATLATAGELLWRRRRGLLAVGSQGVAYALIEMLRRRGDLGGAGPLPPAGRERVAAASGSVSATTEVQLASAEADGFVVVPLEAAAVVDPVGADIEVARTLDAARRAWTAGRSVLVASARGPDDPAIGRLREAARGRPPEAASEAIGDALGRVLAGLLGPGGPRRLVVSGGDTSGHAARRLGLRTLVPIAETVPGAALCRARRVGGGEIEIALKGGQMGTPDYFAWIRDGGGPRP